jgi:hypothetical protein
MHSESGQAGGDWASSVGPVQVDARAASAGPADRSHKTCAIPVSLLAAAKERVAREAAAPEADRRIAVLREHLDEVRRRAAGATSWLETSRHYLRLLNTGGFVPVTARFDVRDLMFLGRAREDLLGFAELGLRLTDLHRPLNAGGTSSDPGNPALRCRNCMWRWPCPTFRIMSEVLAEHGVSLPG